MSIISSFNNLDKRFAWSFSGFILAAIFGSITIYTEFFRVNTPDIVVEILDDTNVLDIKEDINELKVSYGDVDISSLNQTLSVLFLRIRNDGGASVLNSYYDENYPLNITLKEGKFLKAEQTGATNEYLKSAAQPHIEADKIISLPNIIIEPNENYTIKILALHKSDSKIKIDVIGKIAGTKEIEVKALNIQGTEPSFWEQTFHGGFFIQLTRLPIYFFGFIFLLISTFLPIIIASDAISKKKRKKVVKLFKEYIKNDVSSFYDEIFTTYVNHGLAILVEAKEILAEKKYWDYLMEEENKTNELTEDFSESIEAMLMSEQNEHIHSGHRPYVKDIISSLITKIGALSKSEDNRIIINSSVESGLVKFIDFVVIKES
ncbi:hypothetical protein [Pectobacterium versatile]|uniref:hypothetical protein n=1 Tax=Pectobacterium versatile TaxID=2488639 RepID=UPI001CF0D819|nr:hypothetical protein [Pectobacterium versatile]MCA6926429.1 hypothetical protein [Pectobacterium versatile]MCH5083179.1 hypothetical protein [Pectobacterium versatile]